jgi:3-phenylpropionate/cinnamic acid dioxygenase small subunit
MDAVVTSANGLAPERLPAETRLPYGSPEYDEVMGFLIDEADALDSYRWEDWLLMLAPDVTYRMPVRLDRMPKDGPGFVYEMEFFSEDFSSLTTRVKRLGTKQAWAEQPVSRTRHLIGNVRVHSTDSPAEFVVVSSFIVTRVRWDMPYDLFTGERRDILRRAGSSFQLARRIVYFDQTHLQSHNLSIVL